MAGAIALRTDVSATGTHLDHFRSRVVGAGRADEGQRAGWQAAPAEAHAARGSSYVRFHGLFHDDMFHGGFGMITLQGAPTATEATGAPWELELVVDGQAPGPRFAVERLDATHGNALAAWTALIERGARATAAGTAIADDGGTLRLTATLPPWAVVLVREVS